MNRKKIIQSIARRVGFGLLTLFLASILIFLATQVLPWNAANAILGNTSSPARVHVVERQLHLNEPLLAQYWHWLSGLLTGDPGTSYVNNTGVAGLIGPRILNSAVLVALAGLLGTVLGVILGIFAAVRRDTISDHALSSSSLVVAAVPEYVIATLLIILLSVNVLHLLPATFVLAAGAKPWSNPEGLVLPVLTLVIVVIPYIFRMMRGAVIEALESEYVEMARLEGLAPITVLVRHALPNALAPTIQVVGLQLLYLAGGIVVVEFVFNYPGIGQALVNAVEDRDVPVIQFIVLALAAFYVIVNITTDMLALWATPRRRLS